MATLRISGDTSGYIDLRAPTTGAANVFTFPATTGTINTSGSANEVPAGSAAAPSIFPTGDTNTGIFFPSADTIAFAEGGVESMRITSDGRLGIGTTTPLEKLDVRNDNVSFGTNGVSGNVHIVSGLDGSNKYVTRLRTDYNSFFSISTGSVANATAPSAGSLTERMRITSNGSLVVGTAVTPGADITAQGMYYLATNGFLYVASNDGNPVAAFNRNTNDGTIVEFKQAATIEGSISVSGTTVSYNQFLGSHWAALTDWSKPDIKIGTILDSINELVIWKFAVIDVNGEQKKICYNGNAEVGTTVSVEYEGETYQGVVELEREREFTKAVKVKINDTAASKAVYGVFVGWNNDKSGDGGTWNDMYVGAVGNYVIRMAAGQEPEIGDLIEADGNGCGVVQDDDIVRTKTVGKITSNIVQKTYEDGSFLVTCVLYSG